MSADQIRNRTVGCRMTESEYEKLAAVAEQDGQTLGEWCREVLLERAEGRKLSVIEETALAETLALRHATVIISQHDIIPRPGFPLARERRAGAQVRVANLAFRIENGRWGGGPRSPVFGNVPRGLGYDGDGKRAEKVGSEIYWYGLGSEPLMETDWSGNLENEYVFLGGKRMARRDASGSTVDITATSDGTDTDYTLSTSYTYNSPFTSPAFTSSTSGATLTGGENTTNPENGTGAYHFTLVHDAFGNVTNAQDSANGNWNYAYDRLNRLCASNDGGASPLGCGSNNTTGALAYNYVYDRYGNRTQANLTAGASGWPISLSFDADNHVTTSPYAYDAAGDTTSDGNCSYTYNGEQRMASATCLSSGTTDYVYDAAGQRVAKMVGSTITEQDVYNLAGQVILRYNGTGSWTEGEVWAGGAHLAIYANGQTYFPVTDQVGTERARFASTGGIVETCTSGPFGEGPSCSGTDSSPYLFGKLERDSESGDDHAQHRDYNSTPGRWLTPDPAGTKVVSLTDPQTWNLYEYSHDNPVTDNDPSGLGGGCGAMQATSDGPGSPCPGPGWVGQNAGAQYQLSQKGLEFIEKEEGGFYSHIYDASGKRHLGDWTIGYGHRVLHPRDFSKGITKAQGVALLKQDVATAVAAVNRYATATLSQNQVDALVSFTFNLGSTAFQNSTLRARVVEGETVREHDFTVYHYSRGQPVQGLLNRRIAEYDLFSNGDYGGGP